MDYPVETFTDEERALLAPHFTNLDRPVFALVNLPETVKGALFARYSRYQGTLRRLYLDEFAAEAAGGRGVRRRGGRARPQALRAHLHRLRRRLGRAARRGAHRLRVGLERHDEGAPARASGGLPRAVDALHGVRRPDGRGPRLPLLARPVARPGVRGGDGLPVRSYSEALPRVEAWAAERFPRSEGEPEAAHARSIRAKALDLLRGLLPAASLSHVGIFASGQAYEQLLLRLFASPLPEARDYASHDPRGAEGRGAELRGARGAARPRGRVDRVSRGARGGGRALGGAARPRPRSPRRAAAGPKCGCCRCRGARRSCWRRSCSRRPPSPRTRRAPRCATCPPDERAAMLAELVGERAQPASPARARLRGDQLPLRGGLRLRRVP